MSQAPHDDVKMLEQMVAYLDGELSADECAQVEKRLTDEPVFRQQLQEIQRAWEALDQLPIATVEDDFSRTTMEMVVDVAHHDLEGQTAALPVQRRKRGLTTMLLATTALLLGLLAAKSVWKSPNRLLLANLALIDNIDVYSQIESAEMLDRLRVSLDATTWPVGVDDQTITAAVDRFEKLATNEERRSWIDQLPENDRAVLRAKFNRFCDLPNDRQQQLRKNHEEIASNPQRVETLARYGRWLSDISASRQFQLREQPLDERIETIRMLVDRQAVDSTLELSEEELTSLIAAMHRAVRSVTTERQRQRLNSLKGLERLRFLAKTMREHPDQGRAAIDQIVDTLPEEKQAAFNQQTPREQRDQLQQWIWQAIGQHRRSRLGGDPLQRSDFFAQQLEQIFVELDPAEQQRLLALPTEHMQRQLQRTLFGQKQLESRGRKFDRHPPPRSRRRSRLGEDHPERPPHRHEQQRPHRELHPRRHQSLPRQL